MRVLYSSARLARGWHYSWSPTQGPQWKRIRWSRSVLSVLNCPCYPTGPASAFLIRRFLSIWSTLTRFHRIL